MNWYAASSTTGSHSGSSWLFLLISGLVLVFSVTIAIKPSLQWKMNRWQFKNPQAFAPSQAGLIMTRVIACVVAIVAIVFIVIGITKL